RAFEGAMTVVPSDRCHRRTELVRQLLRSRERAVDDENLRRTAFRKAPGDRPRAAACADDDCRSRVRPPGRLLLQHVLHKPVGVVVGAPQRAVLSYDDAADGANTSGDGIDLVDDGEGALLVRDGQVAAGEGEGTESAQRAVQIVRLDGQRHIRARKAMLPEEEV